jgi:acetyltransferase (GNAT) family protein
MIDFEKVKRTVPLINPFDQSLLIPLFQDRNKLIDQKNIRFKCTGLCMYPVLRKGDDLNVSVRAFNEIKEGDILVYRRKNRLVAHRVSKVDNDDHSVSTCTDRGKNGCEELISRDKIVGIVDKVYRKGRTIGVDQLKNVRYLSVVTYVIYFCKYDLKTILLEYSCKVIGLFQDLKLYKFITRYLYAAVCEKAYYQLYGLMSNGFYRKIDTDDYVKILLNEDRKTDDNILLAMYYKGRLSGYISCKQASKDTDIFWRIVLINTRIRYRNSGIETILLKELAKIALEYGFKVITDHDNIT